MSIHTYEDDYTCLGECDPQECRGHKGQLVIVTDTKMYFYSHGGVLKASGHIDELHQLGSMAMEAGDDGVI